MTIGYWPTHVVVDTRDGQTFSRDLQGHSFTLATATEYARERNAGCNPGYRSYQVFTLLLVRDIDVGYDHAPSLRQVTPG
jgi:hypothetical protein